MKLPDSLICISCDELVPRNTRACPCCTSEALIPLTQWIEPLEPRAEIELVHAIAELS